jgi:hypothetical protein
LDRAKGYLRGIHTLGLGAVKSPVDRAREDTQNLADDIRSPRPPISYAGGGFTPPMGERYAQRQLMHSGFLHSPVPGRTDKLPITVGGGAYVLPADHVAAVGQGNSLAGANIVNKMFKMGPAGTQLGGIKSAGAKMPHLNLKAPTMKSARGGAQHHGTPVQIVAAGGEIVIPPEKIIEKYGSLDRGHRELDDWVKSTRRKHIKTLRKLKPPRKD